MKRIIPILFLFVSGLAHGKCISLSGIIVEKRFSSGEYLIQYRNGYEGLGYHQQHPKYDLAVLRLDHGGFKTTGQFNGRIVVTEVEKTVITLDGFDKKVPLFKEVNSCN